MRKLLILMIATFVSAATFAQGIKGKITDGSAMPGVSILVQGTNSGTVSDTVGNYSLPLSPGSYQLIASFIGAPPL